MIPLPNARQLAKEAIRANPSLLKDCLVTEDVLVKLMNKWRDVANAYTQQDQPIINEIKKQLQTLNNLK